MTWKQALRESIDKWDAICFKGGVDKLDGNCSLCIKGTGYAHRCVCCPVSLVAGNRYCESTPYIDWADNHDLNNTEDANGNLAVTNDEQLDLAIQEYLFLCMLYHEYYGEDSQ